MGALLDPNREGATLLVNLHDVRIARRLPRVVAPREGRVVFDGPPEELTDEKLSEAYAGDPRDAPGSAPAGMAPRLAAAGIRSGWRRAAVASRPTERVPGGRRGDPALLLEERTWPSSS